jgi:hypothetical protein
MTDTPSGAEASAVLQLHPEFQRAFLAVRYFLGARGAELAAPLRSPAAEARAMLARLDHPDRARRAETLALEVGQVLRALEARVYR